MERRTQPGYEYHSCDFMDDGTLDLPRMRSERCKNYYLVKMGRKPRDFREIMTAGSRLRKGCLKMKQ